MPNARNRVWDALLFYITVTQSLRQAEITMSLLHIYYCIKGHRAINILLMLTAYQNIYQE